MPNAKDRNASVPALPAKPMFDCYTRPGVMYRESDVPGAAKHLYLPPESELRAHKGDLGMDHMANFESRATDEGNKLQARNLKRGK
jgi:hypothetical protein